MPLYEDFCSPDLSYVFTGMIILLSGWISFRRWLANILKSVLREHISLKSSIESIPLKGWFDTVINGPFSGIFGRSSSGRSVLISSCSSSRLIAKRGDWSFDSE